MILNANEIRVFFVMYGCDWAPDTLQRAYEAIISAWMAAGFPPDRLAARAPGIGKNWKTFKGRDKRLRQTRFEDLDYFCLSHLAEPNETYPTPDCLYPDRDWLVYSKVAKYRSHAVLGWIPALVGGPSRAFLPLFQEVASLGRAQYGFRYQQRYNPRHFSEEPPETPASRDASMNSSWWEPNSKDQLGSLLLRDIYPQNFLSADYLHAPIGKTAMTLREWIEDEPVERGELKPFTDTLTEWAPPVHNIPKIREALYRAGRVFYWKFFSPVYREDGQEKPQPLYRPDPRAPWEAPEPIPEIYRVDYWKDKDPGLIY